MQVSFARAALSEVEGDLRRHLQALPGPIDSFLEDHVRASSHHMIRVGGERAGLCSVHEGRLLTHFSLDRAFLRCGQAAFQAARRLENVGAALVPTCDELFLSHALDDYRQLLKQAYFFEAGPSSGAVDAAGEVALRSAAAADEAAIRQHSGDFFGDVAPRIERGELFVTERAGAPVGYGIMENSKLLPDVASIGMFTLEAVRGTGVATATISLLIQECARRGIRPVAGCWYYNHSSKRALERAGMVTRTRLLRVEY